MHRLILLFALSLFLFSCNSNPDSKQSKTVNHVDDTPDAQLPALPAEYLTELYNKCEAIEITFYDAPMSMASNKDNTRSFLSFITRESVFESQLRKRALGIMSYNVDGDIFIEAEFFIDLNNSGQKPYFKFIKDKQNYYNVISTQGVNLLTQPLQGMKQ